MTLLLWQAEGAARPCRCLGCMDRETTRESAATSGVPRSGGIDRDTLNAWLCSWWSMLLMASGSAAAVSVSLLRALG